MLFNKYSFLKHNEDNNIRYCPFCGVDKEYLTNEGHVYKIDINSLDNQSLTIIDKAMKLEAFNSEFYGDASKIATDDKIKILFEHLSNIELMHAKVHQSLGGFKNLPKLAKPDYSRHNTDLLLLKEAHNREKHAIAFYNKNIDNISNGTVQDIMRALVAVENEHIDIANYFSDKVV